MGCDRKEWLRFMNRKPKKEKKVEPKEVEKVYLAGDHDLFVELCEAEETIKNLKLELKALTEKYNESRKGIGFSQQAQHGIFGQYRIPIYRGTFETATMPIPDNTTTWTGR